jgi:hypothetical protein
MGQPHEVRQLPQEGRSGLLVQGELRTGEYTDEKKVTRQTVELVAQTILRIDYTKIGVAEQGDAAEPEAE